MQSILCSLSSHQKLERDRGLESLALHLKSSPSPLEDETFLLQLLEGKVSLDGDSVNSPWEQLHGGLQALNVYTNRGGSSEEFPSKVLALAKHFLGHSESRVRNSAGQLLGTLAKQQGQEIYGSCKPGLLTGIRKCLERHEEADSTIKEKLGNGNGNSNSSSQTVFHDTAGWGHLETNMKALEAIISNTGSSFDTCIDLPLLDLVFDSLKHTNRFVRETGYMVCCALVSIHPKNEDTDRKGQVWSQGARFASALEIGLSDNWSQVRMAACCATRAFLTGIPELGRDEFFPQLLPPLCLNRFVSNKYWCMV